MQQKLIWNTQLAAKSDLASLQAELDKIDVDTLKTVPSDLRKLSNVVDNVAKKTDYWGYYGSFDWWTYFKNTM